MLPFLKNKSFAIDLGNNNTLLTDENQILLSQPSFIAFEGERRSVKAIGDEAFSMYEKSNDLLKTVKPLQWGVIADYDSAAAMINKMVRQVHKQNLFNSFDHIISGVPYYATEVERRALRDVLDQFNSKKRQLIVEPLAAAVGMNLNIREPEGKMVIDIGGGITEIVIISLSGVAVFQSVKVAGDSFTMDIQDHFRRIHNLSIGWKTAEQIKIQVGAATSSVKNPPSPIIAKGKDIMEGIPTTREVDHSEVAFILNKSIKSIEESIIQTLEVCPPELSADIYQNGIHLTGGSALLRGLKERLQQSIQLPVHLDEEPLLSVSKGISRVLREPKKYQSVLLD
ncbi:MAG TPA: rod shape-determining protein [Cyclobacteriaceae bacterium]|jgi:rod shape-determining protein MreB|nr:rod shape-determining protein [Cyclobacteriaceae bacterium]